MNKRPISVRQIGKEFYVKYSDGSFEPVSEVRASVIRDFLAQGTEYCSKCGIEELPADSDYYHCRKCQ